MNGSDCSSSQSPSELLRSLLTAVMLRLMASKTILPYIDLITAIYVARVFRITVLTFLMSGKIAPMLEFDTTRWATGWFVRVVKLPWRVL